jgi:hypothetical protein
MNKFLNFVLCLTIIFSTTLIPVSASYTYNDMDELEELIAEQEDLMDAAHRMAEAARDLSYDEEHDVIQLAKEEYYEARALRDSYKEIYDELAANWKEKEAEYPAAAYIWKYFKDLGYGNAVVAGILGNIMAEVGGQTLNIQYTAKSAGYYGMCQWNKNYSQVWGKSLEEQCDFLQSTIKYELDTYGYAYARGFNYESFLALTDEQAAAKAFAKAYERCGSGSYSVRQRNATTAYNYFTN